MARMTPLPPVFPFDWAVAHGEDPQGLWQAFELPGTTHVRQRLRWIPPGQFLMGSPPDEPERGSNELQHAVVLTQGLWLADTACTQALWSTVLGQNPSRFSDNPENPVENVSWNDVVKDFLLRLNDLLPGLAATLPNEAQWEYACRAGTQTPFSFGDTLSTGQANYNGNFPYAGGDKGVYREKTVPVLDLPANDWGLYQMHGNVWEWCRDGLRDYAPDGLPVVDPEGPGGPSVGRALRGGSWLSDAQFCRCANRSAGHPGYRLDRIGFRLARGLPEATRAEPAGIAEPEARRAGVGAPALRAEGAPRSKGEGS